MVKQSEKTANIWVLAPLIGVLIYISLYITATLFYPGGSQVDRHSKGFSWLQNYWCNLLNETAINGQPNPARPVALTGMFVLCLTLIIFWYSFPQQVALNIISRLTIQVSGILSMCIGLFVFTRLHDMVINIASFFGLIAITGTFVALFNLKWRKLFWLGIFNLALVALNNILYYGDGLLIYLPGIQKISFLFFLLWICLINVQVFNQIKHRRMLVDEVRTSVDEFGLR